ncbi:PTS fructose transporter subunit IIC [Collinsella sp. zg1085]|uniref:PTS fructose transporter subunit IIC n=1 Tax=Collinsella sp. zg1085 TaxID=2844380 RepID=UPI001C0E3295|nr:PTS fructose transporter subunit IIC [Collinsella sp. zg1085]QWT17940.1 PTS fructose transporter subunit IIC [Collinsella sp. zg1085]
MAEIQRKGAKAKKKSELVRMKDAIMTGVSYMIPFIVGGGVLQGIAKAMGGYDIAAQAANLPWSEFTLAMTIHAIGAAIFTVAVPIIGAYVAFALADKPGIAPGFAVGVVSTTVAAGFLGALVGGIMAAYVTNYLKELSRKVPEDVKSVFPILLIPVGSTLICCLMMWYVIGVPIGWLMTGLETLLTNLQGFGRFAFGAAIGAGMSTDQGGPISKAVALFTNGLNTQGILGPTASKMCGGMQNPLGICIAMLLGGKKKFSKKERSTIVSGLVLGCCYIQEYVIPFLIKDTWRCIIPCMIGGAVSGGTVMLLGVESAAVHGGVFVVAMMSNPLVFVGCWLLGACVTGVLYAILRQPLEPDMTDGGNAILDQLMD